MFIIVMNYDQVFDVLALIFDSAFSGDAAKGGFVGVLVQGFQKLLSLMKRVWVLRPLPFGCKNK